MKENNRQVLSKIKEKITSVDFERLLYNGKARMACSAVLFVLTFAAVLFATSFLPHMTASPVSENLPEEYEKVTQMTTTEPETQAEISSETATEAETLNKSKFKRDKTVKAAVATGDDRVDEDSGGNRVVDSSTNGNNSDIVVSAATIGTTKVDKSLLTDYSYAVSGGLQGPVRINNDIFLFGNSSEHIRGHATIGGFRYYFNNYGAKASRTGIDVSKHQGTIDWAQVKAAGVDYAIIRIAYRGYGSDGKMRIDPQFEANISGARANGIDVGVYFFSQAVNVDEAVEEASLVLNTLNGRKLQYPVYIDMEYANAKRSGRADRISKRVRTDCAVAFCETVRNSGYKAGIYASKAFYDDELTFSRISGYNIWVAHYTKSVTDFSHRYEMWQYSEKGKISGIKYKIDLDISFYDYAKGNNMSEAGSKVIFVPDSLELAKYTGAEALVNAYSENPTDDNYNSAFSAVNSLSDQRVVSSLNKKLAAIKEKAESTTVEETTETQTNEPLTEAVEQTII